MHKARPHEKMAASHIANFGERGLARVDFLAAGISQPGLEGRHLG
jgi:hypothetical protein